MKVLDMFCEMGTMEVHTVANIARRTDFGGRVPHSLALQSPNVEALVGLQGSIQTPYSFNEPLRFASAADVLEKSCSECPLLNRRPQTASRLVSWLDLNPSLPLTAGEKVGVWAR